MFERELVRELVGGAAKNRRVAGGVQREAAAQLAGVSNAGSLRAATRSVSRLRPAPRDYAARRWPTKPGLTECEFRMIHPADSGGRPERHLICSRVACSRNLSNATSASTRPTSIASSFASSTLLATSAVALPSKSSRISGEASADATLAATMIGKSF